MIFYFTGTGNSLYTAQTLASDGEAIISVIDALRTKSFNYVLKDQEKLGFVFPVFFYTVSDPVLEFIRNLKITNASFVYAVIPCGASIGSAGAFLKSELKKRGLELQRVDPLVVPDGALIFYDIDSPDNLSKQLGAAANKLAGIKVAIDNRKGNEIKGSSAVGKAMLAAYHASMSTKPFYVESTCIHCGQCAKICPAGAISMVDGMPSWTKDKCLKCCGCINRCPASAIQYGKKTVSRGRYVNPVFKK